MLTVFLSLFLTLLFLIYQTRNLALKVRIKLIFSGFISVLLCVLVKRVAIFLRDINK